MKLKRYQGNPILTPCKEHAWEAQAVFNAAAVYDRGLFHLLYRAQGVDGISSIGYALSRDGFNWLRLDRPVLEPADEQEAGGVEDPRVTRIGDTFYMCYVAYSGAFYQIALARSQNLIAWERLGFPLPGERNKDAALFPEKIGGRYCMLHRREPDIWLAYSDDLIHWGDHQIVMRPRPGAWDSYKIGTNGPPLKTEAGWLLFYHGFAQDKVYRMGVALLDLEDPTVVLKRQEEPILEPEEEWEREGDVPNVIFSCGQVMTEETLYVYYGGADTALGVATAPRTEVEEFCQS